MPSARHLLTLLADLPATGLLSVSWLREQLTGRDGSDDEGLALSDLTVEQAATEIGRARSTIRTWCNSGELEGAYRLRGREWRVPRIAFMRFLQAQTNGKRATRGDRARSGMDSWRGELAAARNRHCGGGCGRAEER